MMNIEPQYSGNESLMERILCGSNLREAFKKVVANKGSAGVDGMKVEQLADYLRTDFPRIREELITGKYRPSPVRRVSIPKDDGGIRELGIPTVIDRFIQQSILQVLQPIFDPTFSNSSYGFRPQRSAKMAVLAAKQFVMDGREIVVDVDLAKFFDRVNHDILMGRLAKRIQDTCLLRLIRRFLESGVMVNGVVNNRNEGTPQGGPISPFLANFLLDEVDKELERRGLFFARYADDLNVYVKSERAGERVLALLRKLFTSLKLTINEEKSSVAHVSTRKFLGFTIFIRKSKGQRKVSIRIANKAKAKFKDRIRELTQRSGGRSLKQIIENLRTYIIGWRGYFRLADTPSVFDELDGWIRHRLRAIQIKHWKRGTTAFRSLIKMGAKKDLASRIAAQVKRPWFVSEQRDMNFIMPIKFFRELGLPSLLD